MKFIVGLGNPDLKYFMTRHNTGFRVIDKMLIKYDLKLSDTKFKGIFCKTKIEGEDVLIAKPMTYMNLSGEFIRPLADFYKIDYKDIIVIYDELALPIGKVRLSFSGSSAGHNGIKSIIQNLKTEDFIRVRIGIGPVPSYIKIIDFVLMNYTKDEISNLQPTYEYALSAIEEIVKNGVNMAMNKYNNN